MAFMDDDFLLETETAKKLYHGTAEALPVIDYRCYISPKDIYDDLRYENITQAWLGADNYKWRLMRCAGKKTRNEINNFQGMAIFKNGATL